MLITYGLILLIYKMLLAYKSMLKDLTTKTPTHFNHNIAT